MFVNWRRVLADNPELLRERYWYVSLRSLKNNLRAVVRRNRGICCDMRHGGAGHLVARNYGVSPSFVRYLMQRCSQLDERGQYLLGRALVPAKRRQKATRRQFDDPETKRIKESHSLNDVFALLPRYDRDTTHRESTQASLVITFDAVSRCILSWRIVFADEPATETPS